MSASSNCSRSDLLSFIDTAGFLVVAGIGAAGALEVGALGGLPLGTSLGKPGEGIAGELGAGALAVPAGFDPGNGGIPPEVAGVGAGVFIPPPGGLGAGIPPPGFGILVGGAEELGAGALGAGALGAGVLIGAEGFGDAGAAAIGRSFKS